MRILPDEYPSPLHAYVPASKLLEANYTLSIQLHFSTKDKLVGFDLTPLYELPKGKKFPDNTLKLIPKLVVPKETISYFSYIINSFRLTTHLDMLEREELKKKVVDNRSFFQKYV